jgi:hypothetical protein
MSASDDSLALLTKLCEEIEKIISKGFFSPEFEQWHASIISVLQQRLPNDSLLKEFQQLQFEWPREALEGSYDSFVQSNVSEGLEKAENQFLPPLQARQFRNAMEQAKEILVTAIIALRSKGA